MSAAECARCGKPAVARVRWFLLGRDQPMFDVCAEHRGTELRLCTVLNKGRAVPQFRVRVTELPEQLVLVTYASVVVAAGSPVADRLAALRLYRSCRERDMRPWEALEHVRAQASAVAVAARLRPVLAERARRLVAYVDGWRPVVAGWQGECAFQVAHVDRILFAEPVLDRLAGSAAAARGGAL